MPFAPVIMDKYIVRYLVNPKGIDSPHMTIGFDTTCEGYEAMIAAIFLDQGYDCARKLVLNTLNNQLETFHSTILPPTDPKSHLQEYLQSHGSTYPIYRTLSAQGPDHDPTFTIHVLSNDILLGTGTGKRKSEAERAAAQDALEKIGI